MEGRAESGALEEEEGWLGRAEADLDEAIHAGVSRPPPPPLRIRPSSDLAIQEQLHCFEFLSAVQSDGQPPESEFWDRKS